MKTKARMYHLAIRQGYALGAFNVFNLISAQAVVDASNQLEVPVILQMSTSTVKKIGIQASLLLFELAKQDAKHPVSLHLDHCTDIEFAKRCVDAGWKSIMFDGSSFPYEENIRLTREIVDYCQGKGVLVEGEIGAIQGVEDEVHSTSSDKPSFDQVLDFIERTQVDTIAPAIGTAHGIYTGTPKIDFELVRQLSAVSSVPIVVHGGTGLSAETFAQLIALGVAKINVSTALKHAYLDTMKQITQHKLVYDPLSYDRQIRTAICEVVMHHMTMFGAKR